MDFYGLWQILGIWPLTYEVNSIVDFNIYIYIHTYCIHMSMKYMLVELKKQNTNARILTVSASQQSCWHFGSSPLKWQEVQWPTYADLPSASNLVGQRPFLRMRADTLSASFCSAACRSLSSLLLQSWLLWDPGKKKKIIKKEEKHYINMAWHSSGKIKARVSKVTLQFHYCEMIRTGSGSRLRQWQKGFIRLTTSCRGTMQLAHIKLFWTITR